MATFITSKTVGQTMNIYVQTSTGFWKYNHDGSDSSVFSNGGGTVTVTNSNGEFTIISCDSSGNVNGDITLLSSASNQITSFDGTGLSGLTNLSLTDNQLTSFDSTGLSGLTILNLSANQLTTFDGIDLNGLTTLELSGNQLTSFDGTGLVSLTNLNVSYNQLISFDTDLSNLTNLQITDNLLTSFDGTGLSNLTMLYAWRNQLTSFNGNGLSSLTNLNLSTNQLTTFDGTGLSSLTQLDLSDNNQLQTFVGGDMGQMTTLNFQNLSTLTSFDGTGLTSLTTLNFGNNPIQTFIGGNMGQITNLYLDNNSQLTTFIGSGMTSLTELGLSNNQLTSLDGFIFPTSLTTLYLQGNQLTSFDGTGLSGLTTLYLNDNQFTSFDGTDLSSLNKLYLQGNQLTSFDGTGLSGLTQLYLNDNQFTSFDGTGLVSLTQLDLYDNQLTSFDGTGLSSLTYLNLQNNQLTSFDGTDLSSLTNLYLRDNQLTSLDGFIFPTSLTELYLNDNQLTSLDGTGLSSLTHLYLQSNQLISFDSTGLSSLHVLGLGSNQLTSFDGTDLSSLTNLQLSSNQLTSFDGTDLTSLGYLELQNNQLTSFDGTGLTSLGYLYLQGNLLTSFNGTDLTSLNQLHLNENQLTSFDGTGLSSLTYLGLQNNQLTSFDGTDLTSLYYLVLPGNQLTSLDVSPMVSLQNLYLVDSYGTLTNPMTVVSNNSILSQLDDNGVESGNFITINGRTSAGTADYDALVGKGWHLIGLDLVTPPPSGSGKLRIKGVNSVGTTTTTTTTEAPTTTTTTEAPTTTTTTTEAPSYTIKTIKPVGEPFGIQNIVTSTGYWLYSHDGTNSAPYEGNARSITVTNANGEFTFISCLSDGTPSGNIIELGFNNGSLITDFNGLGLSSLTFLNLQNNQLTSFDGTDLTSLTNLNLNSNEELTSITNLPLTLVSLTLVGTPITSIDISGMDSLTSLYLADAYGTNALVTSTNNSSILEQLDSSDISDGSFITSNGRTSAGNTSYDNLINKGWNIMGAEEDNILEFDLTVDNGIPNQLVVLSTLSSDGGFGGGGRGPGGLAKGPGGPGGGITEYASIVTDENGIAVFSGITGSTTMWAVQVYNTPVKEGMVVWVSHFEANNSTTSVTKTRTFYDVNFLNQDDNGVISNSSVDIYLVSGSSAHAEGDIYPIFMFSGTTDVNGNITTNLSNGSYIIRTFDENGDLTWGQYFGVADDVVSITRPLSEDVSISLDLRSSWSNQNYSNINTIKVDGLDIYYYDGQQNIYSFNPENPIYGDNPIVNPPLVYLGVTDENGLFTTESPIAISSGYLGIQTGTEDANGIIYEEKIGEEDLSNFNLVGGIREYIWSDYNLQTPYATWDITVYKPSGELALSNLVTLSELIGTDVNNNLDWYGNVDALNIGNNQWGIQSSPYKSFKLKGGTTYRINIYNGPNMIDGYTEIWTPGWNESKSTVWTRSYVS